MTRTSSIAGGVLLTRFRISRRTKRAQLRSHRRGRRKFIIIALLIVLTGFLASTARLFVWPDLGTPSHVDAIVMLNGPGDRLDPALRLAREHRASTLVISQGGSDWGFNSVCAAKIPGVRVICFIPSPETTRGEAEFTGLLAKRYHWHSIVLVTTIQQDTRARLRVSRCFNGRIYVIGAQLPASEWLYTIAYEWAALTKAVVLQRSC